MNQADKNYIDYVKQVQAVRKTLAKTDEAIAKMQADSAKEEQILLEMDAFESYLESWKGSKGE